MSSGLMRITFDGRVLEHETFSGVENYADYIFNTRETDA